MLLPRIEHILSEIRDLEAAARRGHRTMEGRFRLGIIPTVAPYLLPFVLPVLRERHPALQIELREAMTDILVEETATGGLDAFVGALPVEHEQLIAEPLFEDRFQLAVPLDDPCFSSPLVPPESPVLERLILLEEGHCLREQALAVCGKVKPAAMTRYGATSLTTLLQMVAHGMGITLIPELAIAAGEELSKLKVVPFAAPQPSRTICLAWRRNGQRQEVCRTLAALIQETRPILNGSEESAVDTADEASALTRA